MGTSLLFDKKSIEQAEKDYSKLNLKPTSKQYIENFAKLYAKYLPISELAMKGFISFALRDFQMQTHVEVTDILKLPPVERQKHFTTLTSLIIDKLSKILVKQEQHAQLVAVIQEANKMAAKIS